jgi:hypothetical protein
MTTTQIVRAMERLPASTRRRILGRFLGPDATAVTGRETSARKAPWSAARQRAAIRRFVARSQGVTSAYTDVSANKSKHLAEIYAPHP